MCLRRPQACLGGLPAAPVFVERLVGNVTLPAELGGTSELFLRQSEQALALGDHRAGVAQRLAGLVRLRLRLAQIRLEILGVHAGQSLAGHDRVALFDQHLEDAAGPLGRNSNLRGLEPSIAPGNAFRHRGLLKPLPGDRSSRSGDARCQRDTDPPSTRPGHSAASVSIAHGFTFLAPGGAYPSAAAGPARTLRTPVLAAARQLGLRLYGCCTRATRYRAVA